MRLIERHRTTHLQLDGSAFRVLAWCTTCERDLSREFLKSDPPRARPHATLLSQKLGYHCTHTDEGLHAQKSDFLRWSLELGTRKHRPHGQHPSPPPLLSSGLAQPQACRRRRGALYVLSSELGHYLHSRNTQEQSSEVASGVMWRLRPGPRACDDPRFPSKSSPHPEAVVGMRIRKRCTRHEYIVNSFCVVFCIWLASRHHTRACLQSRSSGDVNLTNPTSHPPPRPTALISSTRQHKCWGGEEGTHPRPPPPRNLQPL